MNILSNEPSADTNVTLTEDMSQNDNEDTHKELEDNDDSWTDVNLNEDGDLVATARIKGPCEDPRNLDNLTQSRGKGKLDYLVM